MTFEERRIAKRLVSDAYRERLALIEQVENEREPAASPTKIRSDAFTVRPDALLCTRCNQWLPDNAFPWNMRSRARRQRHSQCRPCQSLVKREYRLRVGVFSLSQQLDFWLTVAIAVSAGIFAAFVLAPRIFT